MKISAEDPISRVAVEAPDTIRVMESFGIRFYDSTSVSLEAACARAGAKTDLVLAELRKVACAQGRPERWDFAPLPALVRFILDNHHTWERNQVRVILKLIDAAGRESGDRHPEIRQIQLLFAGMSKGFLAHLKTEEAELFPVFVHEVAPGSVAEGKRAKKAFELLPLTERLVSEHDVLLTQWDAMRSLSGGFQAAPDAGASLLELFKALIDLELYQHQHVHKENFILFEKIRRLALKR